MRPRADRPVNKSCEVTVPGSPGRGNGENRPSGQPAADNRSGPAVSRKPESDRLLVRPFLLQRLAADETRQIAREPHGVAHQEPLERRPAMNPGETEITG